MSAPALLSGRSRWGVAFRPGQSALGHHWDMFDGAGAPLGRTKLFYEGAGKTVGRLLRATGLSTSGTLHAAVLDTSGNEVYRLHSYPGRDGHLAVERADHTPVGTARRNELAVEITPDNAAAPALTLNRASKEDIALTITDLAGTRVGVLAKQRFERALPSVYDMVFLPALSSNQIAFAATMHLGYFGGHEYHVEIEQLLDDAPAAELATLTPLIAAYGY